jgi:DNA-binding MarR family transcriptional regulator
MRSHAHAKTSERPSGGNEEQNALNTAIGLREALHEMEKCFARHLAGYGLCRAHFLVLQELDYAGGNAMTVAALAERTMVDSASMRACIEALEELRFIDRVVRRSGTEQPGEFVHLTDSGKQYIERQIPTHYAALVRVFQALSPSEQHTLLQLHGKLTAAANRALKAPCLA